MRILVIGGTHFMGPYVINNLHQARHEITIFHRGKTKTTLPVGVQEILGNRDHLPEYASELRKTEPEVVLDMIVLNERHARELMQTFSGVSKRVVVISSMDVYHAFGLVNRHEEGEPDNSLLTEDSPVRSKLYPYRTEPPKKDDDPERWKDEYDKIPAERIVMNYPGLPGTILRLPAVYGPHDAQHRMFLYLKRMLDGRQAILLEDDVARWRWTHGYVENVTDAITLAVTNERASGRLYNVGEPFALSLQERVEQIGKAANWHGKIITLPVEQIPEGLRWGINAAQDVIADTSRIRQELGYSERIDQAEAFRRTIAWERDNWPDPIDVSQFDYAAEDQVLSGL